MLTLVTKQISTHLPCLESEFQNGQLLPTCFLNEAITTQCYASFSPFAECVMLVTLYGRSLSHYQISTVEHINGNGTASFWLRHQWIDSSLTIKLENLLRRYSTISILADPMLVFAFMVGHSSVLHLCKSIDLLADTEEHRTKAYEYQARAISAAQAISHLAKANTAISYFKASGFAHPISAFGF